MAEIRSTSSRRLKPLTREVHEEAARLLNQVEDNLHKAANLLGQHLGAPYVDKTLRIQRDVQTKLIDPLKRDWERQRDENGWRFDLHEDPHQAINYVPRR